MSLRHGNSGRGTSRPYWNKGLQLLALMLWLLLLVSAGNAQDSKPRLQISVSFEPGQMVSGVGGVLTIYAAAGQTFPEGELFVRLPDFRTLPTTRLHSRAIQTDIPADIPPGSYRVNVLDSSGNRIGRSSSELRIVAQPTAQPTLPEQPTIEPGEPSLVTRNFTVNPSIVPQGGTTTLTFEVVNQGTVIATGISATIDAGDSFVPASGQASATIPDIFPGGSAWVTLSAVATQSATAGPTSVPVTITYRDFTGEIYTSKASLSVTVQQVNESPQITLSRYQFEPNPATPGEPLTVTTLITNTGSRTASQTLLRIAAEGILLPGTQGDSFPLGELAPGASVAVELPLVVSREAKPGPQAQGFTLTYLQNGESKEIQGSMTIEIAQVVESTPLMLLEAYEVDQDPLEPGARFKLTATVKNAGEINTLGMLVTFGTVETSSGSSGDDGSSDDGSSTSTTPSTTFAPLGTGGTIFVGDIPAGETATFTQEFIVNGTVNTGIYSLPITLRYQTESGKASQDNLRASVVVVEPPDMTITEVSPIPPEVNVGEPFFLAYEITNDSTTEIELTTATTTVENGEVIEGAEMPLGVVAADDSTSYNAGVMALEEGTVTVNVTIRYLDELNTEREIVKTYETMAVAPPPPVVEEPPPFEEIPTPLPEEPEQEDWLGRLLLGLLGLGS